MNDNNLSPSAYDRLDDIVSTDISAQELLNRCSSDSTLRQQCYANEQRWWTYLLQRDYPQWGVIDKAKEYYIRIAKLHGITLINTSEVSQIFGPDLLRQQRIDNPTGIVIQLQVMDLAPFPVASMVARAYSGALSNFIDNLEKYSVTDPSKWIFHIEEEGLGVEHADRNWAQLLNAVLMVIFMDNVLDGTVIERLVIPSIVNEVTAAFDLLQCQGGLCDILTKIISSHLETLGYEIVNSGTIRIEPVKILRVAFGVAPGYVLYYLQALTNLLYVQDAFTMEIIEYYQDLIHFILGIKLSLMPRGYPFTKRENLDKFGVKLFEVNPLAKPFVMPDYLNATVFGQLDLADENFNLWRAAEKPYPIITHYPPETTIIQRMELVLPGIIQAIERLKVAFKEAFPQQEAGFIVAGGMFSIIFDDYLSTQTQWLMKTDVDFFVYGISHEWRVKGFELLIKILTIQYPMGEDTRRTFNHDYGFFKDNRTMEYSVLKSVVTAQRYEYLDKDYKPIRYKTHNPDREPGKAYRLDQYERSYAFQVINTNSKDGFEVIMNFDTSHIQIGFDVYSGWIATPYWELYYPRREALLVRYNIRGTRFTKALYRGFTLKTIMPYALLLKMTGSDYATVIRKDRVITFAPRRLNTNKLAFADDLNSPDPTNFSHRSLVKNELMTKNLELINVGARTELENPSRVSDWTTIKSGRYVSHKKTIIDLYKIIESVQYDGQFKNGFDGYVNSEYLTFKINAAPRKYDGNNRLGKFLLRDARILADPRTTASNFPQPGTDVFRWSIMTEVLLHSKIPNLKGDYNLIPFSSSNYGREFELPHATLQGLLSPNARANFDNNLPKMIPQPPPPPKPTNADSMLVLEAYSSDRNDDRNFIHEDNLHNPDRTRGPTDLEQLPRNNLALVAKAVPNVNFPDPEIFSYNRNLKPSKRSFYYQNATTNRKKIIHKCFNFPVTIEGIVSFNSEDDFDSLDLHAPMLTDDQRQQLPRLSYEEFTRVATGKLQLDYAKLGFQYVVTFPASVSESVFLDEADWTMDLDRVLSDRGLTFNSICIFDYPLVESEDLNEPNAIKVVPYKGDKEYLAKPPSILKIFRSFLIIE